MTGTSCTDKARVQLSFQKVTLFYNMKCSTETLSVYIFFVCFCLERFPLPLGAWIELCYIIVSLPYNYFEDFTDCRDLRQMSFKSFASMGLFVSST